MKTRDLTIILVLLVAIIAAMAYFIMTGQKNNSHEYLNKADKYGETGDSLKKASEKIEDQVKQKQNYFNSQLEKMDESIKILEKSKAQNKELIKEAKNVQGQLLDDYCKDMAELGQTNIEQCKNRKQ